MLRHLPAAEFVEEEQHPLVAGCGRERQHFAARGGEAADVLVGGFGAAGDDGRSLPGRADELAAAGELRERIEDDPRGTARRRPGLKSGGEQRVVDLGGAAADEDRIDAAAQLVDDLRARLRC